MFTIEEAIAKWEQGETLILLPPADGGIATIICKNKMYARSSQGKLVDRAPYTFSSDVIKRIIKTYHDTILSDEEAVLCLL